MIYIPHFIFPKRILEYVRSKIHHKKNIELICRVIEHRNVKIFSKLRDWESSTYRTYTVASFDYLHIYFFFKILFLFFKSTLFVS